MAVNERFLWAIHILQVQPQDEVLEIGCGAGLLVEQIAERLETGKVAAIDRSAAMIKLASRRNRESISTGNVKLVNATLTECKFDGHQFDKITAFNVNFFWKDHADEFEIVRRILKLEGMLYIFCQQPFEITIKHADPIKKNLEKHSFEIIDTIFKKMKPFSVFCVKARLSR